MNWYEVLEVSPSASPQVIRAAYKSLMQCYHPDKAASPVDAQRATQLAQAYAVLSDVSQRQAYDQQLQRLVPPPPVSRAPQFHRPLQATAPHGRHIGMLGWLGLVGLVLLGGVAFKAMVLRPSVATTGASAPQPAAPARTTAARRVHLPGLVVHVRAQSPALNGEDHNLTVPSLVLELGPWQADQAAWRLGQPSSNEALEKALAAISYEALIAPDGQTTLARSVRDAANTVLGPPMQPPPISSAGIALPYGVQSVVLPDAFAVR